MAKSNTRPQQRRANPGAKPVTDKPIIQPTRPDADKTVDPAPIDRSMIDIGAELAALGEREPTGAFKEKDGTVHYIQPLTGSEVRYVLALFNAAPVDEQDRPMIGLDDLSAIADMALTQEARLYLDALPLQVYKNVLSRVSQIVLDDVSVELGKLSSESTGS